MDQAKEELNDEISEDYKIPQSPFHPPPPLDGDTRFFFNGNMDIPPSTPNHKDNDPNQDFSFNSKLSSAPSGGSGLSIVRAAMQLRKGAPAAGGGIGAARSLKNPVATAVASTVRKTGSIASVLSSVTTGEDAAAYFARMNAEGIDSTGKVIHLKPSVNEVPHAREYNLFVSNLIASDSDYFTMSSQGIIHVCPGEHSEVVPLSEWMHHCTLYKILCRTRLFRLWRASKALFFWRESVRHKRYLIKRAALSRRVFFSKSNYCVPLLQIRNLFFRMQEISFYSTGTGKLRSALAWEEEQDAALYAGTAAVEDVIKEISIVLRHVLLNVESRKKSTELEEEEKREEERKKRILLADKKTTIASMKTAAQNKVRECREATDEVRMMREFIRLVDYFHAEALTALLENNQQILLKELSSDGSFSEKASIELSVSFVRQALMPLFTPDELDITNVVSTIKQKVFDTIAAQERLIKIKPFSDVVNDPIIPVHSRSKMWITGINLRNHLKKNLLSVEMDDIIINKLEKYFEVAREYYSLRLQPVRAIYDFQFSWNFSQFRLQKHGLKSLKSHLMKMDEWNKQIEILTSGHQVSWIYIESRKLKEELSSIVSGVNVQSKALLVEVARDACTEALSTYNHLVEELCDAPEMLVSYATFVSRLKFLQGQGGIDAKEAADEVSGMYSYIAELNIKVDNNDLIQLDDMVQMQAMFYTALKRAEEFVQGNMEEMVDALETNLAKIVDGFKNLTSTLESGVFVDPKSEITFVLQSFVEVKIKLDIFNKSASTFGEWQFMFVGETSTPTELTNANTCFKVKFDVWNTWKKFEESKEKWLSAPILSLDTEFVKDFTDKILRESYALDGQAKDVVSAHVVGVIKQFKEDVPTILDLGNKNLKFHHWEAILSELGQNLLKGEEISFSLRDLQDWGVFRSKAVVSDVSSLASGEAALVASLEEILKEWETMDFDLVPSKIHSDVLILGGAKLEDIFELLEEHQVALLTMLGSRYIAGVKDTVEKWEHKLRLLNQTLEEWVRVQRSWIYLEPIFTLSDMIKQMRSHADAFKMVDIAWREVMKNVCKNPKVMLVVDGDDRHSRNLHDILKGLNVSLEEIQKGLEDYLQTKRVAFPRFYFLSDDELLDILSQSRDPLAVQPHLRKCFDSISSLHYTSDANGTKSLIRMCAMLSAEGEKVAFLQPISAVGFVEKWLSEVENSMRACLRENTRNALFEYESISDGSSRLVWLSAFAASAIISVDRIKWTHEVTVNIANLFPTLQKMVAEISDIVSLVKGPLTSLQRMLLGALTVIKVHGRDVVKTLYENKIENAEDFEWTRQLRYYWINDDVQVQQGNGIFSYNHEYLGNTPRLVITPLTDRCYLTLTGALSIRFGGAPEGPAGTGKTETVKDLAKALGRLCIVFNCSDALDFKIMGRFFSGLAQAGAWACFDEFNRIEIEVLSVIAQQILTIQQAVLADAKQFEFHGQKLSLNSKFGVFITMNPGYAGRVDLPDNLKALFRPIAMMVPDYKLIAEIILFSESFLNATSLANKMTQLYKLSSEQLSKQDHYDFGLRALKSVLSAAGRLKRLHPDIDEDVVLIRAMRDSNIPKFLSHDLPLFMGIISDLFPGVDVPYVDYGKLQLSVERKLRVSGMQGVPSFVHKIIQIHETQLVRHGMMVVGESGCGKSTAISALAGALTALKNAGDVDPDGMFKNVVIKILNPKAIAIGELYGSFNLNTHEWSDGVVPHLLRQAVQDTSLLNRHWLIFDGPVDAGWIENMNTVLDDTKLLCLANSERVRIPQTTHLIFEVVDLAVASPATVSRCGMVYMEQIHLGILPIIRSWIEKVSNALGEHRFHVQALIEDHLQKTLEFVRTNCSERLATNDVCLVLSFLKFFESTIFNKKVQMKCNDSDDDDEDDSESKGEYKLLNGNLMQMNFAFSLIWSLGGNLDQSSRDKFDIFIRNRLYEIFKVLPKSWDVFSILVDHKKASFSQWAQFIPKTEVDSQTPFYDIVIPTADTIQRMFILKLLALNGCNLLMAGETGVGKTVVVRNFLHSEETREGSATFSINFSAQTSSQQLRETMESKMECKRKVHLLPAGGKKTQLIHIDDVNMPQPDKYGCQSPLELLRQIIDLKGFYDVKNIGFKSVNQTFFIATCAPPGGGRNVISPRVTRHFNMIWIPQMSEKSMVSVFQSILSSFFIANIPEYNSMVSNVVNASVKIFTLIQKEMLPTPSKSHYTFNMRDLAKVFQGMMLIQRESVNHKDDILRLWLHELSRVFRDRLIEEKDTNLFDSFCDRSMREFFRVNLEKEKETYCGVLFGDYNSREPMEKKYASMTISSSEILFKKYLEEYNMEFSNQMHLVFFHDAIQHLNRISRILKVHRGNALLVGIGGSGRRSLTRLAAFISSFKTVTIEVSRSYGFKEWREDLKKVLISAGTLNSPLVFLINENQLVDDSCIEDLNHLLNTGEIPNLYNMEEMQTILDSVTPLCKKANMVPTRDNVLNYYTQLVRTNVHFVLCFSPAGDAFRLRCLRFPSLVSCCSINWFNAWPATALYGVASKFLSSLNSLGFGTSILSPLADTCVYIYHSVEKVSKQFSLEERRKNYITPTTYLELVKMCVSMMKSHTEALEKKVNKYKGGLEQLARTQVVVSSLREDLQRQEPLLQQASVDTSELLIQLDIDREEAKIAKIKASEEEKICTNESKLVREMKEECQRDLDEAMPAYRKALKALKALNKDHLVEVRSYVSPPVLVATVMDAVCILLEVPVGWKEAKRLLVQGDFLDSLTNYDKDNIKKKTFAALKPLVLSPDFNPDKLASVSIAATSLCMWVRAIYNYHEVLQVIKPKQKKLSEAETKLSKSQSDLNEVSEKLRSLTIRVESLQVSYESSLKRKNDLTKEIEVTKFRLINAEKLVGGLGGETQRWKENASQLELDKENIVGNVLVAAASVAYCGPFNSKYREILVNNWISKCQDGDIPVDVSFDLARVISDPVRVQNWRVLGLPADNFSTENGVITTMSRRFPLLIDPQDQALRWVKQLEKDRNIKVIQPSNKFYLRDIENSIRYGIPVLLEEVGEELDPALDPVLLQSTFQRGGQTLLNFGEADIPYSAGFKLYLTTKIANPTFMPEVYAKVCVINFTVTPFGLEEQLLVEVVQAELPELEKKIHSLILSISNNASQLSAVEDEILVILSSSEGNILDDQNLIDNLYTCKDTALSIKARSDEQEKAREEITKARDQYRSVAKRGSVLFFVLSSLSRLGSMYQYSLQYFQNLYNTQIKLSAPSEDLDERLKTLIKDITQSFYKRVSRGLFERHKVLFSLLIASEILKAQGEITDSEWSYFLYGNTSSTKINTSRGGPSWLPSILWSNICNISNAFPAFIGLSDSFLNEEESESWKEWFTCDLSETVSLPGKWSTSLSSFQELMLLRSIREEKTVIGVSQFISRNIGNSYISPPVFDLEDVYMKSTNVAPIVFILSPGADPITNIMNLAKMYGKAANMHVISLGQGQGMRAEAAINVAKEKGHWVCLQNCHLSLSWLPTLARLLQVPVGGKPPHNDYRLWLTSMPSKLFPVSILQACVKVTLEPPNGIRANILRTYMDLDSKKGEFNAPSHFKSLLFSLAFYHAVCLERRKFGGIGWNIPYGWMQCDFRTAYITCKKYICENNSNNEVPFKTIHALVGEIIYGGRVTDAWDKRTNLSLLKRFVSSEFMESNHTIIAGYSTPDTSLSLPDLLSFIDSFPLQDHPHLFGLNENADKIHQNKLTRELVSSIISLQPQGMHMIRSESNGTDEVAHTIQRLLSCIPNTLDIDKAHVSTFSLTKEGHLNSLGVVCEQEIKRFNNLINIIKQSLDDLQTAMKGLVVMSPCLEKLYEDIRLQKVPKMWQCAAYPSLKGLASWCDDLSKRVDFIRSWLENGSPKAFWISGLFFPQGFITGMLQQHSRKTRIPIDILSIKSSLLSNTDTIKCAPVDGVYIYGLFLEGARWDAKEQTLAESFPDELFQEMPVIWLEPAIISEIKTTGSYECPVYKTCERAGELTTTGLSSNYILTLHIPTTIESEVWICRGVAGVCAIDI